MLDKMSARRFTSAHGGLAAAAAGRSDQRRRAIEIAVRLRRCLPIGPRNMPGLPILRDTSPLIIMRRGRPPEDADLQSYVLSPTLSSTRWRCCVGAVVGARQSAGCLISGPFLLITPWLVMAATRVALLDLRRLHVSLIGIFIRKIVFFLSALRLPNTRRSSTAGCGLALALDVRRTNPLRRL